MVSVKCAASSAADSALRPAAGSTPTSASQPCRATSFSRMPSEVARETGCGMKPRSIWIDSRCCGLSASYVATRRSSLSTNASGLVGGRHRVPAVPDVLVRRRLLAGTGGREQRVAADLGAAAQVREHVGDGPVLGAALGGQLVSGQAGHQGGEPVVDGAELRDRGVDEFGHRYIQPDRGPLPSPRVSGADIRAAAASSPRTRATGSAARPAW